MDRGSCDSGGCPVHGAGLCLTGGDGMSLHESFVNFWRTEGKYMISHNPERLYGNLARRMEQWTDTVQIDEYVLTLRSRKETTRALIVAFYDYLRRTEGIKVESPLYDVSFYDYAFMRQLEMAKFLQQKRTLREIDEHFHIDERTRREDLQALENGLEVFGAEIKITKTREDGRVFYESTLHPIFLPLNLTEVYAMTEYLKNVLPPDDPNSQLVWDIVRRIELQLSDYAIDRICPADGRPDVSNDYRDDRFFSTDDRHVQMYLMKRRSSCRILWMGKEYTGTFEPRRSGEGKGYVFRTESGEILDADPRDIEVIRDSFVYK